MELVLVRHALPERIVGADGRADPPLSEVGHRQAHAVAGWLSDESFDALYASPLRRGLETAAPIAERTGLDVRVADGIAEYDRDSDTYIPVEELGSDSEHWKALVEGRMDELSPEGHEFRPRVAAAMDEIIAAHAGQRVLAVCHSGVINVFVAEVLGLSRDLWFQPDYASFSRLAISRDGPRSVVSLNETPHLRGLDA